MTNWTPDGFIGGVHRTIGRHLPPPPGATSPALWAMRARLADWFEPDATSMVAVERTVSFRYRSTQHWLTVFRGYYGPMRKAFAALDEAGQVRLEADLLALVAQFNRVDDGTMVAPSEYLEIVIARR